MQQPSVWCGQGNGQEDPMNHSRLPRRAPNLPPLQAGLQLTRDALRAHRVVCQLDKSFILVTTHDGFLLCFDQHAVDERVRLERLLREVGRATATPDAATAAASSSAGSSDSTVPVATPASSASSTHEAICRVAVKPTLLKGCFSPEQLALLATPACKAFLSRFCFDYQLLAAHGALLIRSMPKIERAVPDVKELLVRLLKDFRSMQQHQLQHQGDSRGHSLPSAIRHILNSRACRFAIMFGTELKRAQCKALLHKLATTCDFPFTCAHGRPSCVPLCHLGRRDQEDAAVVADLVSQQERRPSRGARRSAVPPLRFCPGFREVHLRRFAERCCADGAAGEG